MGKSEADGLVDVLQIAADFGCSDRQVQIYASRGMPKAGHGKYNRQQCSLWYIAELKRQVDEAGEGSALEHEQTRVQRATADLKELELAEKRGALIPLDIYKKNVAAHFFVVRQNVLAQAAQIAPQLEGLDRLEIKTRLHQKNRDMLTHLAAGDDLVMEKDGSDDSDTDTPESTDDSTGRAPGNNPPGDKGGKHPGRAAAGHGASASKPGHPGIDKGAAPGKPRTARAAGTTTGRKPKRMGGKKHNPAKRHK